MGTKKQKHGRERPSLSLEYLVTNGAHVHAGEVPNPTMWVLGLDNGFCLLCPETIGFCQGKIKADPVTHDDLMY